MLSSGSPLFAAALAIHDQVEAPTLKAACPEQSMDA
jgi:hypothetical protein